MGYKWKNFLKSPHKKQDSVSKKRNGMDDISEDEEDPKILILTPKTKKQRMEESKKKFPKLKIIDSSAKSKTRTTDRSYRSARKSVSKYSPFSFLNEEEMDNNSPEKISDTSNDSFNSSTELDLNKTTELSLMSPNIEKETTIQLTEEEKEEDGSFYEDFEVFEGSSSIFNFPANIYSTGIFPFLTQEEILNLIYVSKSFKKIVVYLLEQLTLSTVASHKNPKSFFEFLSNFRNLKSMIIEIENNDQQLEQWDLSPLMNKFKKLEEIEIIEKLVPSMIPKESKITILKIDDVLSTFKSLKKVTISGVEGHFDKISELSLIELNLTFCKELNDKKKHDPIFDIDLKWQKSLISLSLFSLTVPTKSKFEFHPRIFKNLHHLEELNLRNILSIKSKMIDDLKYFTNLKKLSISIHGTKKNMININSLKNLKSLKVLHLNGKYLKTNEDLVMNNLEKLEFNVFPLGNIFTEKNSNYSMRLVLKNLKHLDMNPKNEFYQKLSSQEEETNDIDACYLLNFPKLESVTITNHTNLDCLKDLEYLKRAHFSFKPRDPTIIWGHKNPISIDIPQIESLKLSGVVESCEINAPKLKIMEIDDTTASIDFSKLDQLELLLYNKSYFENTNVTVPNRLEFYLTRRINYIQIDMFKKNCLNLMSELFERGVKCESNIELNQ
eukprot:gene5513-9330_t